MPETAKYLVGVRLLAAVDKSHRRLLSMCAETCAWGLETTVRPHARGPGAFGPRSCGCGTNRRLRRRERTTVTASRRSTAFRAQGRREMKADAAPRQPNETALETLWSETLHPATNNTRQNHDTQCWSMSWAAAGHPAGAHDRVEKAWMMAQTVAVGVLVVIRAHPLGPYHEMATMRPPDRPGREVHTVKHLPRGR